MNIDCCEADDVYTEIRQSAYIILLFNVTVTENHSKMSFQLSWLGKNETQTNSSSNCNEDQTDNIKHINQKKTWIFYHYD